MNHRTITSMLRGLACALAITAASVAGAAHAQEAGAANAARAQAGADLEASVLLEKAVKIATTKGLAALKADIPALTKALESAPAPAARADTAPPGTDPMVAFLRGVVTNDAPRTYATIGLIVGSYYVEVGQMEQAIAILDKGLVFDPGNPGLLGEKGVALGKLGRFAEAVAAHDVGIAANKGGPADMARLHRARGVALIDLKRLDEAEAALKTSLELQPGHPLALNELKYIAQIRGGAAIDKPIEVMTTEAAAKLPVQ